MKPKLQNTLLAICCADLMLLAACGGGGGSGSGMVRSDPPPVVSPPPTPPPPPQRTLVLPPAPTTTAPPASPALNAGAQDFLINLVGTTSSISSVSTAGALTKRGDGRLYVDGPTRFDGSTHVEAGAMELWGDLHSDLTIASGATFEIGYGGTIIGDVDNHGVFEATEDYYTYYDAEIFGDYSQSAEGLLRVVLGLQHTQPATPLLTVAGTATLDGTLEFRPSGFIPSGGYLEWVLHAHGGVTGQFAQWTSPGLFIEGNVRYGSNDVYLEATRVSVASAMAANGIADAMTLASAGNLDRSFASADLFARAPAASLSASQQRLLASAASIQHVADVAQATRTLDSLSGHAHAGAWDALHAQATASAMQLDAHLGSLRYHPQASAWSRSLDSGTSSTGNQAFGGHLSGVDQWLGPRLLVGGSLASGQSRMQFERMGGHGRGESPMASVYAHYRSGGWHATGLVGAGRTVLQLDRPIDLGAAGEHVARSRRDIDQAFLHGELGRRIALGRGVLTPFVAADYTALHGDGFIEQGDTGFELVGRPASGMQLSAAAGARYARGWHFAGNGWLRLDLDARYLQPLAYDGDALRAAFTGAPDAPFDLAAWSRPAHGAAMTLGLTGGRDDRWAWSLDYAQRFGGDAPGAGWFVGLRRDF